MKKTRILIALMLCVIAVFSLAACGGDSADTSKDAGSNAGATDTIALTAVGMSLEEAQAKVEEAGCTPVVISVYDEKNEDGAVLCIGEFKPESENGFTTLIVNDLSIKETVEAQALAPRIIPKESYESKIFSKISSDETLKKTFESMYTFKSSEGASEKEMAKMHSLYPVTKTMDIYILDAGASAKEIADIESVIKEKTEYTATDMFNDYVTVGIVPTPSEALIADVLSADNCEITESEDGITIVHYNGESQNIVIPATIDGKTVVKLADGAIPHSTLHAFTTVDGLLTVEAGACSNAYGLLNVVLSDTIMEIGYNAFENALFTETEGDFTTFADEILLAYNGADAEVAVPDGIRFVGAQSFLENKTLTKVTLPEGVQSIGTAAFKYCDNVTEYNIPSTTLKVCDEAFRGIRHITSLIIPDSVIEIGNYAFHESNDVVEFKLGESVKKIGDNAFEYLHLITALDIPESVEYLGNNAFLKCKEIAAITGGEGLKFVGAAAFEEVKWYLDLKDPFCFLTNGILIKHMDKDTVDVVLPAEVTCISGTFAGAKKPKTVVINDGCVYISNNAFTDMVRLTDVTIPASVTYIDPGAFDKGNLNLTIHCPAGSAAEAYAQENHLKYDNNI